MVNVVINFIKKYWKYMLCFLLGVLLTCLVPTSPMSNFLKRGYKYINKKEQEIQVLKDANNQLQGQNTILKRDKDVIEKRIVILEAKKDSLDIAIKNQDKVIEKINDKYEEIKRIDNFNDKQLHQFFSDYGHNAR